MPLLKDLPTGARRYVLDTFGNVWFPRADWATPLYGSRLPGYNIRGEGTSDEGYYDPANLLTYEEAMAMIPPEHREGYQAPGTTAAPPAAPPAQMPQQVVSNTPAQMFNDDALGAQHGVQGAGGPATPYVGFAQNADLSKIVDTFLNTTRQNARQTLAERLQNTVPRVPSRFAKTLFPGG